MTDLLAAAYPWTKAAHVLAIISWMAALLYLPRLFVYHTETAPGSEGSERFKVMEGKLYRLIMRPAMLAAWGFGLLLVATPGVIDWSAGWWHAKLLGVVVMTGVHHVFGKWVREFRNDHVRRPQRHYRIANEVPTLAMVLIVVMVIVRPF